MHKPGALISLLMILVSLGSCSAKKSVADEIDLAGYENWERTTNEALNFPIPGHESNFRRIYMNKAGMEYRQKAGMGTALDYPDGTIVVKEIYSGLSEPKPEQKPIVLDLMIKQKKSRDGRGGWLWVVRNLASGQDMLMKGDFCVNCHDSANEEHPYGDKNPTKAFRDFLFY